MEQTIGEIRLFAGSYAPKGWAFCNGQTLSIDSHQALYSILDNRYGGDGRANFALPKMAPLKDADGGETSIRYIIAIIGYFPSSAS
jgi:microcystin-dependent protein